VKQNEKVKRMKCPNSNCDGEIERDEQKKKKGNFYYCKKCGTVVYR